MKDSDDIVISDLGDFSYKITSLNLSQNFCKALAEDQIKYFYKNFPDLYDHLINIANRIVHLTHNLFSLETPDAQYIKKFINTPLGNKYPSDLSFLYKITEIYLDFICECSSEIDFSPQIRIIIFLMVNKIYLGILQN